jgi:cytidine deaminase
MKKNKYLIEIEEFDSINELSAEDQHLLNQAIAASENAYAPYSNYHVGAALRLEDGKIILGNNQENVAYPSGLCAERVAFFHANSNYPGKAIEAVAITAKSKTFVIQKPVTPCGSCRQVMAETENIQKRKIRVLMMGEKGSVFVSESVESLLPLMFQAEELKIK